MDEDDEDEDDEDDKDENDEEDNNIGHGDDGLLTIYVSQEYYDSYWGSQKYKDNAAITAKFLMARPNLAKAYFNLVTDRIQRFRYRSRHLPTLMKVFLGERLETHQVCPISTEAFMDMPAAEEFLAEVLRYRRHAMQLATVILKSPGAWEEWEEFCKEDIERRAAEDEKGPQEDEGGEQRRKHLPDVRVSRKWRTIRHLKRRSSWLLYLSTLQFQVCSLIQRVHLFLVPSFQSSIETYRP